jgi:hypothetical protein
MSDIFRDGCRSCLKLREQKKIKYSLQNYRVGPWKNYIQLSYSWDGNSSRIPRILCNQKYTAALHEHDMDSIPSQKKKKSSLSHPI